MMVIGRALGFQPPPLSHPNSGVPGRQRGRYRVPPGSVHYFCWCSERSVAVLLSMILYLLFCFQVIWGNKSYPMGIFNTFAQINSNNLKVISI